MFFSLTQFPTSCKILDQTDKMPRNESKNKIIMVNENTFLCKFNIQNHLNTLEYGRQNSICKNFKNQMSKWSGLRDKMTPVFF